jgi:hypothetical protein
VRTDFLFPAGDRKLESEALGNAETAHAGAHEPSEEWQPALDLIEGLFWGSTQEKAAPERVSSAAVLGELSKISS